MSLLRLKDGRTLHKACQEENATYNVAWRQVDGGANPDDALEYAKKHKGDTEHNRKHFYKGRYIGEIFKLNSRPYQRVLARCRAMKWTLERSMEFEMKRRGML